MARCAFSVPIPRLPIGLLSVLAALFLAACGTPDKTPLTRLSQQTVDVVAEPGANRDMPVALDLVVVTDERLFEQLINLSARDWFRRKHQFKLDYPLGFATLEWEVVPGQRLPPRSLPLPEEMEGTEGAVLIYAGYHTDGDHRARLDVLEHVTIVLGESAFSVVPRRTGG